mgnify:CR=1 FL=1
MLKNGENPFGGGVGAGVKVTPVAFLVIKEGNVRMLPVATPANTTADRIVEMVPDTLDKLAAFIDSRMEKKAEVRFPEKKGKSQANSSSTTYCIW